MLDIVCGRGVGVNGSASSPPTFMTALMLGTVTVAVPLLLAGLGEQISESAGVLNLGLEGMMLFGA